MKRQLLYILVVLGLSNVAFADTKDDDIDEADEKEKKSVVTPSTSAGSTEDDAKAKKSEAASRKSAAKKSEAKSKKSRNGAGAKVRVDLKGDDDKEEKDGDFEEGKAKRFPAFELHGYYRMRGVLHQNLDLKTAALSGTTLTGSSPFFVPYSSANGFRALDAHTIAFANMRLRLEPTIRVAEKVRIRSQFDVLDNAVFGETPDGWPTATLSTPFLGESQAIVPPTSGINSVRDAIRVKRVWGEIEIPFGNFLFGRMGDHFGMGLVWNDGGCAQSQYDRVYGWARDPEKPGASGPKHGNVNFRSLNDCNYGDTIDRVMFATKLEDFYFGMALDFGGEGMLSSFSDPLVDKYIGQPIDKDQLDDINQYSVFILRRDNERELRRKFELNLPIFNYGLRYSLRFQTYTTEGTNPLAGATPTNVAVDLTSQTFDLWAIFIHKRWRIEAEAAGIWGEYKKPDTGEKTELNQQAAVFRATYRFLTGELYVGLEAGIASGDKDAGFGVRDGKVTDTNRRIGNFKFDPDFHVDQILFREIIGTVTNAWYFRPWIQWEIVNGFGLRFDVVNSYAVSAASTPGKATPLGLEFDLDIFYYNDDGLYAGFSVGWLLPFAGMNFVDSAGATRASSSAFSFQTRIAIAF
ncbi:MAG: TIGR04551 family protein [Deltaproteobacteria bacterium]|nr:TIGR04551 family protein [Deltaproteobacteria bacterium]